MTDPRYFKINIWAIAGGAFVAGITFKIGWVIADLILNLCAAGVIFILGTIIKALV